ncbi:hypothetical protein SAMN02745121_01459 [Nannocystis exedens]|uniref:Uncharacterized protein n=1 Tax=Nannocystis exedens TaxID=54 RepID=A0A1I1V603_9BACT|nr:hypothetical protein [Nannocystis exedens]PCC72259.1 hypothetical protein NAEX_05338 [Nannocystis exedens]SFD76513.1 hypothetical protein SAMN02745121_01459 [Nannocystis exedens]
MPSTTTIRSPSVACCALLLAASLAFAASAASLYVDAAEALQDEAQRDAWYSLLARLKRDFDDICGDTFCEGEYSNIEPLRYLCSVDRVNGRIGTCVWLFAASDEQIDPATGEILEQPKFWRCPTPLAPDTTIDALLSAVAGPSPLYAPLPGTDRSIYDGLVDCL